MSEPRTVTCTVEYALELATFRGTNGVLLVAGMKGEMSTNLCFVYDTSGTSVQQDERG
jgi:hypothetical protein